MKRIFITSLIMVTFFSGMLYSSRKAYQVVDLYICEGSVGMAELLAKSTVSRKELYVVSYCTCEGVDPSMRSEVKATPCEAPRNMVYSCVCIGKSSY